jgi:alpha-maltose-1-phosphate synthase
MIVISHATGNEFVREALVAFDQASMLGEFWTTLSWDNSAPTNRLLPRSLRQLFGRRSFPESVRAKTRTVPLRETLRLLAGAIGASSQHETGIFSMDAVLRELDRKVANRLNRITGCSLVYAYEDGALQTFRAARDLGLRRIYDLPIGYWRVGQRIFAEEREREPEWSCTLTGTLDSADKLSRKDDELRLADRVVVASTFTKNTLAEAPCAARIEVVPYGAPTSISTEIRKPAGPLKLLFAGSLGQRKGLSYLLKAVDKLKNRVELTLLGRKAAPGCSPLESAVKKHRWIPTINHAGVLREMHDHDVLVFPSLFEGFGLVILEAMAQGTPCITTDHTAGPDTIEDGVDGFVLPIRSTDLIVDKLELLLADRERLMSMKVAAKRKAQRLKWDLYRQHLVEVAREVIAR